MNKSLLVIILLGMMKVSFALPMFAPSQLAVIQQRGYLKVGVFARDSEPFIINHDHQLSGIDIDLAKKIGDILGVKVIFDTSAKRYDDLMTQAYTHEDDIVLSGIVRTAARSQSIFLSRAYYHFPIDILANRVHFDHLPRGLRTVFNDPAITLGELYGSAYTGYIHELYPQARVQNFMSNNEQFAAIESGAIAATMTDELVAQYWLASKPQRALTVRYYRIPDLYADYTIGTSYDYPVLGKWLNTFTRYAVDSGLTQQLLQKYARGNFNEHG